MPPLPSAVANDAAACAEAQVAEVAPCNLEHWDVSPRHVRRQSSFEVNGVHAHILRANASLSAHPAVRPRRKPPYRMRRTYVWQSMLSQTCRRLSSSCITRTYPAGLGAGQPCPQRSRGSWTPRNSAWLALEGKMRTSPWPRLRGDCAMCGCAAPRAISAQSRAYVRRMVGV